MLLYIYFCKVSTLLVPVCESICKSLWCAIVCDCACIMLNIITVLKYYIYGKGGLECSSVEANPSGSW